MTTCFTPTTVKHRLLPCTMMQRSKSAGKQPARPGYVILPSQDPASGSGVSLSRKVSPGPEAQRRQMAVKRTLAPGQVRLDLQRLLRTEVVGMSSLSTACMPERVMRHILTCFCAACSPHREQDRKRNLSPCLKSSRSLNYRLRNSRSLHPCLR